MSRATPESAVLPVIGVARDSTARLSTRSMRSGVGPISVVVTLALASAAGVSAFFAYQQYQGVKAQLAEARVAIDDSKQREAAAGEQTARAEASLAAVQGALDAEKAQAATRASAAEAIEKKVGEIVGSRADVGHDGAEVSLQIADKALFPAGEATLTDRGREALREVGRALNQFPDRQVWVQGHSDSAPTRGKKSFTSNWALSGARAVAVTEFLQGEAGVDPHRLAAVAFGDQRPRGKKGRSRRIEIVLAPAPQASAASGTSATGPSAAAAAAPAVAAVVKSE
jgi:chemotaxis protein MotB